MTFGGVGDDLDSLGLRPSKNLGQNFLTDKKIAEWMVSRAEIKPHERVLEIGPGLGILTERLAARTDNLTAVELDRRLVGHIQRKYGIKVIQGDALKVKLPDFDKVVSNLPYQISSGITMRLLDIGFRKALLMFQKEFAEHLVAGPGERAYSRIAVMAGYRSESAIVKKVSKSSFHPVPKVDSAIVEIVPTKPDFDIADEETFRNIVRALFSHKNRKVRNGFAAEFKSLGLEKEFARELADRLPNADVRPVKLSIEELAGIANYVHENMA